jgi:phenylacetaldehyde dehydrogenase
MTTTTLEADRFLAQEHGLLIGGDWRQRPGERLGVIDPATGATISTLAAGDASDVDEAVRAARAAFESPGWRDMRPAERSALLWRIADQIEADADTLAELEFRDNGKSRQFARKGDVAGAAEVFRYYAGWCTKIYGQTFELSRPGDHHAYSIREPVGVVGLIVPWNFPLLMAAWKLAPALAAGCACVLKPAEETSLTALRLGWLLERAGVPPGIVNIVTGLGHVAGAAIAAHPGVDKVAFTGSTEVGTAIVRAATSRSCRWSLAASPRRSSCPTPT